jgi:hypothetical protein
MSAEGSPSQLAFFRYTPDTYGRFLLHDFLAASVRHDATSVSWPFRIPDTIQQRDAFTDYGLQRILDNDAD